MTAQTALDNIPASIVRIDNETHAMLAYAENAESQSKFEAARQQIRDGEGIEPNAEYYADLNQRISQRTKNSNSKEA